MLYNCKNQLKKSMNSAYSLMTKGRDLEDRPVCITCKQTFLVKNGYTSKLFTHLCNYIIIMCKNYC